MMIVYVMLFFFNDTATTEIYTLSLHDALPISGARAADRVPPVRGRVRGERGGAGARSPGGPRARGADVQHGPSVSRSEEHTSELQSRQYLVCRLLLEKKNK